MPKTLFSVLAVESRIRDSITETLTSSGFGTGYIGDRNVEIKEFIQKNTQYNHLVFLKPNRNFMALSSPENLKKIGNVHVLILGASLPQDMIGFLQEYKTSGFIRPDELNRLTISQICEDLDKKGYVANYHISEEFWINKPAHVFPRPKPKLTNGEEEVLRLLCHNFSVKNISEVLEKNEPAIRAHITNLREKLHAQTLLEIIVITMANMWVKIDGNLTHSQSPFL